MALPACSCVVVESPRNAWKISPTAKITLLVVTPACQGEVRLVGSTSGLGAWCPERGIALRTEISSVWTCDLDPTLVGLAASFEYKFVIAASGGVVWEPGPNRRLPLVAISTGAGLVLAHFGDSGSAARYSSPRPSLCARYCIVLWEVFCPRTQPGDEVLVVGAADALGNWDPQRGTSLGTTKESFPRWFGSSEFSVYWPLQWKCVIRRRNGALVWEEGRNRRLSLCRAGGKVAVYPVSATFGEQGGRDLAVAAWIPPVLPAVERVEVKEDCKFSEPPSLSKVGKPFLSSTSSLDTCLVDDDDDGAASVTSASSCEPVELLEMPRDEVGAKHQWLWSGGCCFGKASGSCEDAFFHSADALGVADGVGSMVQFRRHGVDSAAYARELMQLAARSFLPGEGERQDRNASAPELRAGAALAAAAEEATAFGASTMTVLHLAGSTIGVANLGDSGFMVLRFGADGWSVVTRSKEQQHQFNFPYQLTHLPEVLQRRLPPSKRLDTAADCELYRFSAQVGDLVLLFTDGFSDNLHEHEILGVVERVASANGAVETDPEALASELSKAAHKRSMDEVFETPFAFAAAQVGQQFSGGKEDDITVVAAWVMPPKASVAASFGEIRVHAGADLCRDRWQQ